jgi:aquaporin Z
MNKYLAEFFGVFFWMLTLGCVSINAGAGTIPAIALGAVVAVMTVLMWPISGAHLNPAISVTMWRSGFLPSKELAPYLVFQFLGSGAAVVIVKVLKKGFKTAAMNPHGVPAFDAEFLFTFLLCFAMLHLYHQREKLGPFAGGGIVLAGVFAVGAVSGAYFNPATTLGACMAGLLSFQSLLIYFLAQVLAGFAAPYAYRRLNPDKK